MDEMQQSEVQQEEDRDKILCLNCNHELEGRFCSQCGQDSRPFHRSMRSIVNGVAEGLFDLDGKIIKSIIPILTSPGKLTLSYLDGKRRAQVNPFQLYAFFSFIFFFTSLYIPSFLEKESDSGRQKVVSEFIGDSLGRHDGFSLDFIDDEMKVSTGDSGNYLQQLASYDSLQAALPEEKRDGFITHFFKRRFFHLGKRLSTEGRPVFSEMAINFKENIPNTLIFLLPVFALLLKLFYLRRNFFFVDHLIFSIHQFCFLFLIGTVFTSVEPLINQGVLPFFVSGLALYFAVAMKRVYGQSWTKTIVKLFLISMIFSVVLAAALSLNLIYTLLFQV